MRRPIFGVACFLAAGIVLGQTVNSKILFLFPILSASFFCVSVSLFLKDRHILFWIFIFLSALFAGQALHWLEIKSLNKNFPVGLTAIVGTIGSFPAAIQSSSRGDAVPFGGSSFRMGRSGVRFVLKCQCRLDLMGKWLRISEKIMCTAPSFPVQLKYGDQLILKGEILRTTSAKNAGGFDSELYLEREGLSARFFVRDENDLKVLAKGLGHPLLSRIEQLKNFLLKMIESHVSQPERGVLKAMLLGNREEIPPRLKDDFSKSGTAHLLAISGMNVGLIASIFVVFLEVLGLSKRLAYAAVIFLIIGYCVLCGSSASIVRATLMIVLYLLGFILKRETELVASLSWSAIFILIFDPLQLFDPGFQLSFLTVLVLGSLTAEPQTAEIVFQGPVNPMIQIWIRKFSFYLRQSIRVSWVAWVGTAPLVAHYFFLFSSITILANLVMVPYIWVVMAGGLAFLFLGSFSEFCRVVLGSAVELFTKILIHSCQWFASIPLGHFRVSPPTVPELLIFYAFVLLWIWRDSIGITKGRYWTLLLIFANFFIWRSVFHSPLRKLRVTFLDVGHGDSALIQFPQKGTLLVDTGGGGEWDHGRITIAPFLWSCGITHLDGILITHPHWDHYGGLKYLLEEFSVGTVFDNGDRSCSFYEGIFKGNKVRRRSLKQGQILSGIEDVQLAVLHPEESFRKNSAVSVNDQSLVVQVRYKGVKILLSGDAEEFALQELNKSGANLESHVLKVPHHGSDEKRAGESFFLRVRPQVAIISEAEKNRFNLPSKSTVEFLEQSGTRVFQTGLTGAVTVVSDGAQYTVKTMLGR